VVHEVFSQNCLLLLSSPQLLTSPEDPNLECVEKLNLFCDIVIDLASIHHNNKAQNAVTVALDLLDMILLLRKICNKDHTSPVAKDPIYDRAYRLKVHILATTGDYATVKLLQRENLVHLVQSVGTVDARVADELLEYAIAHSVDTEQPLTLAYIQQTEHLFRQAFEAAIDQYEQAYSKLPPQSLYSHPVIVTCIVQWRERIKAMREQFEKQQQQGQQQEQQQPEQQPEVQRQQKLNLGISPINFSVEDFEDWRLELEEKQGKNESKSKQFWEKTS